MFLSEGLSFEDALVELVLCVPEVMLEALQFVGEFFVLGDGAVQVVTDVLVLVLAFLAVLFQLVGLLLELLVLVVELVEFPVGGGDDGLSVLHFFDQLS